ncbi:transglutaminase family protein [Azoarcus indigens]|uniref:Transglutaminase-like putative cysteine protease n=1 Tax=Azoarcus indigens TaxID=29545 RepID=A0A4R6EDI9_9RHOO|nr:transglutaminase family protein [Azoarcus indigens]NMG64222.1 transglutaminase family protein [Azoarcus indigens]TDN55814.1 transglutaminase-like putative cysteine protease [Azoarcus indigens]
MSAALQPQPELETLAAAPPGAAAPAAEALPAGPVRYHLRHDTVYHYDQPVGESRQLLRLTPRELPWQRCLSHHVEISPEPARRLNFVDGFGNAVQSLHFERDHETLFIRAESWVERDAPPLPALEDGPSWEQVRDLLGYHAGRPAEQHVLEAMAFMFESPHVRLKREFADYAAADFPPGRPLLEAVDALMHRIFREFTFDPEATDVSTPVTEVFERRRGVCQDFAHFMLSCLRSLGLAARYVSGYLLTRPPPGKPRLIGADATHAWVSVHCPQHGWVDFDPTNALLPAREHIVLGWGRDFSDVSPLRGVILGGGEHEPEIAVTVVPADEIAQVYGHDDPSFPASVPLIR